MLIQLVLLVGDGGRAEGHIGWVDAGVLQCQCESCSGLFWHIVTRDTFDCDLIISARRTTKSEICDIIESELPRTRISIEDNGSVAGWQIIGIRIGYSAPSRVSGEDRDLVQFSDISDCILLIHDT